MENTDDLIAALRHMSALSTLAGYAQSAKVVMGKAADEIERLRAAWLYQIQIENECAADGRPCQGGRCGCLLEMQNCMFGKTTENA